MWIELQPQVLPLPGHMQGKGGGLSFGGKGSELGDAKGSSDVLCNTYQ